MSTEKVIARVEKMTIPTYPEAACEELPMFAENRVHQRSSGNPYPNKVVIKTRGREKIQKEYNAIRLENKYIELVILPEIGGRIFTARDKQTGYDFFYQQHVIKPALIGALGSWISGGVEFNWPYHHRPSTFMPVDYEIEKEANGGATVWLSEHDPIDRMKGMVGIHLDPEKTVFETRMKLCNRTAMRHSFLWWENTAVPVNPEYEIFFPPDVDHVKFHYRRSNTTYPIANGMFNGFRFAEGGVDIRKHFNTKHSTSYFCAASEYDFFGGYDAGKQCGVVHVADHNVSTGKKMFTWAYNQLAQSWERALTDTDGAYAELMAGSYSNNQPDFSWLEPYETKNFSQFWYPLSNLGVPNYANLEAAVSVHSGMLRIQATHDIPGAAVKLTANGKTIFDSKLDLVAGQVVSAKLPAFDDSRFEIAIDDRLYFEQVPRVQHPLPELFDSVPMPSELPTAEKRYLSGIHYMQFRDPNADPEKYFLAALELDPTHSPSLTALGELYIRRNEPQRAVAVLEKAVACTNLYNTNPQSGKTEYLLGYAYQLQKEDKKAYSWLRKAAWNEDSISAAMTRASLLDCKKRDFRAALSCADTALAHAAENPLAGPLAAIAEIRLGKTEEAKKRVKAMLARDPLNHLARYTGVELGLISEDAFYGKLNSNPSQTCLDVGFDLLDAGMTEEAGKLFSGLCARENGIAPVIAYYLGKNEAADKKHRTFPNRYGEIEILNKAAEKDDFAKYLLGCLHYNDRRYDEAGKCWEDLDMWEAKRNLAILAWRNGKRRSAFALLDEALAAEPDCEELIFEKAHLLNASGHDGKSTARIISKMVKSLADARDDICTEWAAAYNRAGMYEKALEIINNHSFIPCEGGETVVAKQHLNAWYGIGRRLYGEKKYAEAIKALRTAQIIPDNLGAGLWHVDPLVPAQYSEALCLEKLGKKEEAQKIYEYIAGIYVDFFSDMHLPELPCYQALSLTKLGRTKEAKALLRKYRDKWEAQKARTDSGYFGTTPFFICYMDDARKQRLAYYKALTDFADSITDKTNILQK